MRLSKLLLFTSLFMMMNISLQSSDKKPVDEGQKNVHQEDKTKGSTTVNNNYEYKKVSLSKLKDSYTIRGENLSHAPFICYHDKYKSKNLTIIGKEKSNDITFVIKKTHLSIGDRIYITNDLDSKDGLKNKYVIIEIEFIK